LRNSTIRCETLKMQYQGQPKCHCQCFLLTLHQLPPTSKSSRLTDCVTPLSPLRSQKKFDGVVQCFRCQAFGHTKRYCKLQHVCVKCGLLHDSLVCQKTTEIPPMCGNCGEEHTPSFRGCRIYIGTPITVHSMASHLLKIWSRG